MSDLPSGFIKARPIRKVDIPFGSKPPYEIKTIYVFEGSHVMNVRTLTNDEFVNMLTTDSVINNELVAELLKRYKLALEQLPDKVYLAREERFHDR